MARLSSLAACALLGVLACDGTSAGGRRSPGGGGAGGAGGTGGVELGTDPGAGYGGTSGVRVDLSFVSWEVRTQAWNVAIDEVPSLPRYSLTLLEDTGGCEAIDAWSLWPRPHAFHLWLAEPAVGDCPMNPESPGGCRSGGAFWPGYGRGYALRMVSPSSASVRIDRFDGGVLAGVLHAAFPIPIEETTGGHSGSDGSWQRECTSLTGAVRECSGPSGVDCCNEGKPVEELSLPFHATFCPASCSSDQPACAALADAAACEPTSPDCAAACAVFAEVCTACNADCEGDPSCDERVAERCERDLATCPAECAAAAGQPVASIAGACLAAGASCDGWLSCLSACGGSR